MKKISLIIPFLFSTSLLIAQSDLSKLHWLEGSWSRTNGKPGRSTHEYWTKISDTEWHGLGVTRNGTDTAFVEKLKLIVKDGNLYYVADIPENKQPVYFKFREVTENSFVCENPQHDFPKQIEYVRQGDGLKAIISGNGKSIEYLFERK
ncbi:MAG TPA: DUF6265 family protein [Ohtaekwangia sp.]